MAWTLLTSVYAVMAGWPSILIGEGGTPNGVQAAPKGSLASVRDGATADLLWYVNTDGASAWSALKLAADALYHGSVTPAAFSSSAAHASWQDNAGDIVAAFSNPDVPRCLTADFGAAWAGGDLTVTGCTDQFGNVIAPFTITANVGGRTVSDRIVATKPTKVEYTAGPGGAGHTCELGYGNKIGVTKAITAGPSLVTLDDRNEDALWSRTYSSFEPTTPPDGARVYRWAVIG